MWNNLKLIMSLSSWELPSYGNYWQWQGCRISSHSWGYVLKSHSIFSNKRGLLNLIKHKTFANPQYSNSFYGYDNSSNFLAWNWNRVKCKGFFGTNLMATVDLCFRRKWSQFFAKWLIHLIRGPLEKFSTPPYELHKQKDSHMLASKHSWQ